MIVIISFDRKTLHSVATATDRQTEKTERENVVFGGEGGGGGGGINNQVSSRLKPLTVY